MSYHGDMIEAALSELPSLKDTAGLTYRKFVYQNLAPPRAPHWAEAPGRLRRKLRCVGYNWRLMLLSTRIRIAGYLRRTALAACTTRCVTHAVASGQRTLVVQTSGPIASEATNTR